MGIVIFEDDPQLSSKVSQQCKARGVEFQIFASSKQGLAVLEKGVDQLKAILITREFKSGEDGLTVLESIRRSKKTADIPCVLMSNVWTKSDFARHQQTKFGAHAFYSKKAPIDELINAIEAVSGIKMSSSSNKTETSQTFISSIQLSTTDDILDEKEAGKISFDAPIELNQITSATSQEEPAVPVFTKPQNSTPLPPPELPPPPPSIESKSEISVGSVEVAALEITSASGAPVEVTTERAFDPSMLIEAAPVAISAPTASVPEAVPVAQDVPAPEEGERTTITALSEEEAAKDIPYLFSQHANQARVAQGGLEEMRLSSGSGGDVETLKQYLTMREQDVSVLTVQLAYAKEKLIQLEDTVKRLQITNEDLQRQFDDLQRQNKEAQQERDHIGQAKQQEIDELNVDLKIKVDRIKRFEEKLEESSQQSEKLKERVRIDIRKIRVREKELENKLEILKRDSETLIAARENKILELKRKIDLLEFNYDSLQDQNDHEKDNVKKVEDKLHQILKMLRLASGVIEAKDEFTPEKEKTA